MPPSFRNTILRGLKYLNLFLITAFVLVNMVLGYLGLYSIILTAICYALTWLIISGILNYSLVDAEKRRNYKLLVTTVVLTLFISELSFKYILKTDDTRVEDFGFSSYPYGSAEIENLIRKYVFKQHDLSLRNYRPNTADMVGHDEFKYEHKYNSLGFRGGEIFLMIRR